MMVKSFGIGKSVFSKITFNFQLSIFHPHYSHAIMPYLVSKYAKSDALYPKDLVIRAKIDQRFHFDTAIIFGGAITSFVV